MREKAAVVERCISPSKRTWRRRSYALPSWLKLSAGRGWDAFLDALHGRSASWGEDVEDVRAGAWSLIRATCCWSLWGDLGSNGQSCTRCCRSTAGSCPASCAEGSGCDEPGFGHPIWTHVLHLYVLSTSFHVYFMRISTHVAHCHAAGFTIDLHRPSTICGMCRSGWATSCQMKRTNWTQQVKTWPSWNRSHGSILHNACCMNLSSKSTGSTNGLELPRKCFSWFGVTQDLFSSMSFVPGSALNHWITESLHVGTACISFQDIKELNKPKWYETLGQWLLVGASAIAGIALCVVGGPVGALVGVCCSYLLASALAWKWPSAGAPWIASDFNSNSRGCLNTPGWTITVLVYRCSVLGFNLQSCGEKNRSTYAFKRCDVSSQGYLSKIRSS